MDYSRRWSAKTPVLLALLLALVSIGSRGVWAQSPESKEPIKITVHDWTGQYLTSHIMGSVLKEMGYNIEYVTADYIAQFAGLESGDLHVAVEIWETTGKDAMVKSLATGKTEDMGETGMFAKEEWWYPSYMKEKCPGLPNWEALNKCAKEFATPETAPKGRYLGAPVTWGGYDDERVKALGLNYEVVHAGTDAALFAELTSAYQRKAPILLWVYVPHWAPIKFKGEWVEFPRYTDDCYNNASWGSNKNEKYDCGKPFGWIKKVAWSGMKKKWPGAHRALKAFKINNDEVGKLIVQVDLDGQKVDDAVAAWMKANTKVWKAWTK